MLLFVYHCCVAISHTERGLKGADTGEGNRVISKNAICSNISYLYLARLPKFNGVPHLNLNLYFFIFCLGSQEKQ